MDKVEDKLSDMKLSGFSLENIHECCTIQMDILQQIDGDRYLNP